MVYESSWKGGLIAEGINNERIMYLVCSTLWRENSEAGFTTLCREICSELGLKCCSIWLNGVNSRHRMGYFEAGWSIDDLTISNMDYEINKSIICKKAPVLVKTLGIKDPGRGSEPSLDAIGMPIVNCNIVTGSITLYCPEGKSETLTDVLHHMATELAFGIEQFKNAFTSARQKSLRKEIELAGSIQQSLLPQKVPEVKGITLWGRAVPTHETSGDFYDFIITRHQNLGIAIGDVMGKGIPAALFTAIARTLTRSFAQQDIAPNAVLSEINRSLYPDLSVNGMFLTMFYALYNPLQKALFYASAGHNPPLIRRGESGEVELLKSKGFFVGGRPEQSYKMQTIKLGRGDIVLFYSDGMVEAKNIQGEQFGLQRAAESLKDYYCLGAAALGDFLSMRLMEHIGSCEQRDDITLIVLKVE